MVKRLLILGLVGSSGCLFSVGDVCGFGGTCSNGAGPGDAGLDGGIDAGQPLPDGGPDSGVADAGLDAGPDAGPDAGVDAGTDAGPDAGLDAGPDAGPDAGAVDAGAPGLDGGPICVGDGGLETDGGVLQLGPSAAACGPDTTPSQIIFVDAADGNDGNNGALGSPKLTISAAITAAATNNWTSPSAEIRVCAGSYDENVVLNVPISIKGGYDCVTGVRPALCFDPSYADAGLAYFNAGAPAAITSITSPSSSSTTVTIDGTTTAIPQAVSFDGFTVTGPNSGAQSNGIMVKGSVLAEISNNSISGGIGVGTGSAGNIASIGVLVFSGGTPEVHHNSINGGSASTSNGSYAGSAGIYLLGGTAAFIHDNRIEGGTSMADATFNGVAGAEAVTAGIFTLGCNPLTIAAGTPIEFNSIYGGQGTSSASIATGSSQITAGILVSWEAASSYDVIGNVIEGGDVETGTVWPASTPFAAAGAPLGAVAISSRTGGSCCPNFVCSCLPRFQIIGNKIYGGDSTAGAPSTGILVGAFAASFNIANNMIHAGGARQSATGPRTAIQFSPAMSAVVGGNTLYAGGSATSDAAAFDLDDAAGFAEHQLATPCARRRAPSPTRRRWPARRSSVTSAPDRATTSTSSTPEARPACPRVWSGATKTSSTHSGAGPTR